MQPTNQSNHHKGVNDYDKQQNKIINNKKEKKI